MPFFKTPETQTAYALVAYDSNGNERKDDPDGIDGLLSAKVLGQIGDAAPTDIFLFSHGWRGDLKAAQDQYDSWIDAMTRLSADRARLGSGFQPRWIGVHWPSEPWGDEEFGAAAAFTIEAVEAMGAPASSLLQTYLQRLGLADSAEARELLTTIFAENSKNAAARALPAAAADAYQRLSGLLKFETKDVGAEPGTDHAPFDPQAAFDAMNDTGVAFGGGFLGGVLGPLRTLSFWTMKRRARTVGETGVFQLVSALQKKAPKARVHLMGHSFGCIVVSSLCGTAQASLPRPVDSMALVQGALSLWAFADKIPSTGGPGYFNPIVLRKSVNGPILTTQSSHDLAVKVFYPAAVGLLLENPNFDAAAVSFPKWGGVGTFGIQGLSSVTAMKMLPSTSEYHFESGKIYNLDASEFIKKMSGVSGAHSDIAGPEVAHALWQLVSPPMPVPFGVQAETGNLLPELKLSDLDHIEDDPASIKRRSDAPVNVFGPVAEINAADLSQAGWGVLFPAKMSQDVAAVRAALKPLLDLRKTQAGTRYTEFVDASGYTAGLSADEWLADRGVGLTQVDPAQGVPYYLLLVGSPEDIPFDFQYDLDTFFAVGRLYFDNVDEYGRYAQNIAAFEQAAGNPQSKSIALFIPRNDGDVATGLLHDNIGVPLADGSADKTVLPLGQQQGFTSTKFLGSKATKPQLLELLSGKTEAGTPALLFTGSHGVSFSLKDPDQAKKQGALLTQSWSGPGTPLTPDMYLTGEEAKDTAKLTGTIHFFFACYSAGCPAQDTYSYEPAGTPATIANQTLVARLPQCLLLAGAQAVIGHIDRAWAYSFQMGNNGPVMVQNLRDPLVRILNGQRVGDAMDYFNQRWSVLSNPLVKMMKQRAAGANSDSPVKLANCWIARDDARNYIILGDPAVRIAQ